MSMKIGDMGNILPNQNEYKFNKKVVESKGARDSVKLVNVTMKAHNVIMSVLSIYRPPGSGMIWEVE